MFNIDLNRKVFIDQYGEKSVLSKIIINNFAEELYIPVSYWSIDDYIQSWKFSIENGVLLSRNSMLLTSAYDLEKSNFLQSWVLYSLDDDVFIQNVIVFLEDFPGFRFDKINSFIPKRETNSDDGEKISEWKVRYTDILEFYERICKYN